MATESKKIKIAYFIPVYRGAAMARWALNITDNLDPQKYAVSFVGLTIEGSFKGQIPSYVRLVNLGDIYAPGIFFKLIVYFRKERPDIFVSAFPHINTISIIAKIISKVKTKVVLTEHNHFFLLVSNASNIFRRFFGLYILPQVMRLFYPLADSVICVSNGVAKSILDVVNVKDKIVVIYNPVVHDKIYQLANESIDHPWFLDPKIPIVLAAGRLVRQKDYPTLLRAFALVTQKIPARLVVLGEGPELKKLQVFCRGLGIMDQVAFLGLQKNPFNYMKMASVFVLSSLHEGFGNVIVEAMACGTPVVATDCKSGPGEIIEDGKSGILIPVQDFGALAEAIIKVLSNDSLRQSLSEGGLKRSQYFLAGRQMKQYEEVFWQLVNRSN